MASVGEKSGTVKNKGGAQEFHTSPKIAAGFAAGVSFLAYPVLYFLDQPDTGVEHEVFLALIGVAVCTTVLFLSQKIAFAGLPPQSRGDWYLGWFSLFAFTAIVDLLLAFTISGDISLISWYLAKGERYLQSSYGFAANLWDGTTHWALYIIMIYGLCSSNRDTYRPVYLFWVGSIMFSMYALIIGGCIGEYSHEIQPSTFLNIPYGLIPIYFLARVLRTPAPEPSPAARRRSSPALSFIFIGLFSAAVVLCYVRVCAAAGSRWPTAVNWREQWEPLLVDKSRFFFMQAFTVFFFAVPLFLSAIYSLLLGATPANVQRLADAAALVAGGMAQTQFCLVIGATHALTPAEYHVPADTLPAYLLLQVGLLTLVPAAFAYHIHYNRAVHGVLFSPAPETLKAD